MTAETRIWPTRGAPPHAAGKRQLRNVPSGTETRTGAIFPSLQGTSQNSMFVSASATCASVLGSVEFWSSSCCGLVPAKSKLTSSRAFVMVHRTWNGRALRIAVAYVRERQVPSGSTRSFARARRSLSSIIFRIAASTNSRPNCSTSRSTRAPLTLFAATRERRSSST